MSLGLITPNLILLTKEESYGIMRLDINLIHLTINKEKLKKKFSILQRNKLINLKVSYFIGKDTS